MPALDQAAIIKELDEAVGIASGNATESMSDENAEHALMKALAAIERFAPPGSTYTRRADALLSEWKTNSAGALDSIAGIVTALRDAAKAGRLASVVELVRADVFGDFLEMAQYLLDQKYKDAAAVIAGSALEAHLRALCERHRVSTEDTNGRRKKADMINSDLAKVGAYGTSEQKDVTAWLGRRNEAAHGEYEKYEATQVGLLIDSVRAFIKRYPA